MNTLKLHIPNISCNHCVMTIKNTLSKIDGVDEVEADADTKDVIIDFDPPATEEIIRATLESINYPPNK